METWFTATEKFGPEHGNGWLNYLEWAQLPQLREVISLDTSLCHSLFDDLVADDWNHNVHEDYLTCFFYDLDYVVQRVHHLLTKANILAVVLEPSCDPSGLLTDERFIFYGYDLLEQATGISALTNCGGFPLAFDNAAISPAGLIADYEVAQTIQKRLCENYPDEHHANCELWAIWRLEQYP